MKYTHLSASIFDTLAKALPTSPFPKPDPRHLTMAAKSNSKSPTIKRISKFFHYIEANRSLPSTYHV